MRIRCGISNGRVFNNDAQMKAPRSMRYICWRTSELLANALLFVMAPFASAMPAVPEACPHCTAEDREYARSWGLDAEEANEFARAIQKHADNRDLAGLFSLVDGELEHGPRRRFVAGRTFGVAPSPCASSTPESGQMGAPTIARNRAEHRAQTAPRRGYFGEHAGPEAGFWGVCGASRPAPAE